MPNEPVFHVVLHQPEIAPNTGAIGRTCVAVGAKLWLVRPLGFRLDDRLLKRAGLDYWEHLDHEVVDDWAALLARLAPRRMWLFSKRAARSYWTADFARGDALVFGNESQGLPPSRLAEHADTALCLPMRPEARSLNLSCAVSVAAYEALRKLAPPPL